MPRFPTYSDVARRSARSRPAGRRRAGRTRRRHRTAPAASSRRRGSACTIRRPAPRAQAPPDRSRVGTLRLRLQRHLHVDHRRRVGRIRADGVRHRDRRWRGGRRRRPTRPCRTVERRVEKGLGRRELAAPSPPLCRGSWCPGSRGRAILACRGCRRRRPARRSRRCGAASACWRDAGPRPRQLVGGPRKNPVEQPPDHVRVQRLAGHEVRDQRRVGRRRLRRERHRPRPQARAARRDRQGRVEPLDAAAPDPARGRLRIAQEVSRYSAQAIVFSDDSGLPLATIAHSSSRPASRLYARRVASLRAPRVAIHACPACRSVLSCAWCAGTGCSAGWPTASCRRGVTARGHR